MTKTEFLNQGVDDLRAALQGIFEDPEGEFAEMNKPALLEFARNNWDTIDDAINAAVEEPTEPEAEVSDSPERFETDEEAIAAGADTEEVEEPPLDLETTPEQDPEPSEEQSLPTDEDEEEYPQQWEGNASTNLHSGAPGRKDQRTNRNLA